METKQPRLNDVILTSNPTITIEQMYNITFSSTDFKDRDNSGYLFLITTPRLRYLNKFRVGTYKGTLSKFVADFKSRGVDINILRFERVYTDAKQYSNNIYSFYDSKNKVANGWINTEEWEITRTFDKYMQPIKIENIEHALAALKIVYQSYDEMSETALGMVVQAVSSLFTIPAVLNDKYKAAYNARDIQKAINSLPSSDLHEFESDDD